MDWLERIQLNEKLAKVSSIIRSCLTIDQLLSGERIIDNFVAQLPECDDKHIINCRLLAEYGKRLAQIAISEINELQRQSN